MGLGGCAKLGGLYWHLLISIARRDYDGGYVLNSTRWCPYEQQPQRSVDQ
jgi:hypothetical protein